MSHTISRRNMIATGIASASLFVASPFKKTVHARPPGPDNNRHRDTHPGPTPIRLATRMVREKNETPEKTVKRIRGSGYTAVNTQPSQWTDTELIDMRSVLKKYDVTVFEVGAYSNIIHPDPKKRQEILANIVQKFEEAHKIGGPMVATVSGSCSTYLIEPHPDNWTEETWKLTVRSVRQILKDTAGMDVSLGMEAQITTNIDGPKAHRRLIDDVGDDRCKVNLDPTNMISLATYFHTTELLDECFELLGEDIMGCHAKDTYVIPNVQTLHIQEVCPGKGIMDYETFLARMSRLQWPRAIFPEHIEPEEFPEADSYIKEVASRIGVTIYD
ncbi:MAG: sugar phosphate isomerase/epimerase [Candidatus Latescibacteria bacterium]|nr:sugar phosphate isomerase/epimerase [Candidatus Latescibacterota bacterium]